MMFGRNPAAGIQYLPNRPQPAPVPAAPPQGAAPPITSQPVQGAPPMDPTQGVPAPAPQQYVPNRFAQGTPAQQPGQMPQMSNNPMQNYMAMRTPPGMRVPDLTGKKKKDRKIMEQFMQARSLRARNAGGAPPQMMAPSAPPMMGGGRFGNIRMDDM